MAARTRRRHVPDGYVSGPAAATEATTRALDRVGDARTIILVEGVSDQIAVETLALLYGRDLRAEGRAVVPTGGAQGMGQYAERFRTAGLGVAVLCDAGEEAIVRRRVADAPMFVCNVDLEDELIRAVTPSQVLELLEAHGTIRAFRTLQNQAQWRGRPVDEQLRRFLNSGATRKLRYAEALTSRAFELGRVPSPLQRLLAVAS